MPILVKGISSFLEILFYIFAPASMMIQFMVVILYAGAVAESTFALVACQKSSQPADTTEERKYKSIQRDTNQLQLNFLELKDISFELLFEFIKFVLIIVAINCITQRWKFFGMLVFLLGFGFFLLTNTLTTNRILHKRFIHHSSVAKSLNQTIRSLIASLDVIHIITYFICFACFVDFILIHKDEIHESFS